jgi:peroxiredoxin
MAPDPSGRRGVLIGTLVLVAAAVSSLGLGVLLFSGPVTSAGPEAPLFATLPPATYVSSAPAPVAGAPAPDFTLKTLGGDKVTLSHYRGQPVLINFWASWCVPCRVETPELVRAYEAHQAHGLVILGVNLTSQDSLSAVKAFVQEFKMTYPVPLDETGDVSDGLYRLRGIPLSVFVNRAGLITRLNLGAMTRTQIDEFVGEILN